MELLAQFLNAEDTSSSTRHLEAITLANFLNKAKAGELDGHKNFTFDKICTHRAAILSTYETIYTILKKNAGTIDKIRNNPMIKNIVDLARKEKVASKPSVLKMTWVNRHY